MLLIVQFQLTFFFSFYSPGCSSLDIWDIEQPDKQKGKPLCPILFEGEPSPLQRVFSNDVFVVLRVPSRYLTVKLPSRQYK